MLRIGLVDLDTSHPAAFTRILRGIPGIAVTALWDGHDVWPAGYDANFAREWQIPTVCSRLEELPDHVDAAMIHGVNWDSHVDKAHVFMRAGLPVLIDKPVVGTVRDCHRLLDLQAKYGTLVFGGSSLRYAVEITSLRASMGPPYRPVSAIASGPGDFFSYGIHTTEMLQGCVGSGIQSVRLVTGGSAPLFALAYQDGFSPLLQLQMQYSEWSFCAFTDRGLQAVTINPDTLYEPFVRNFVTLAQGGNVEYSLAAPVEAVRVHIAARLAVDTGVRIMLDELPSHAGFDGSSFTREYAETKRRQSVHAI
jgi:hypothetical protein